MPAASTDWKKEGARLGIPSTSTETRARIIVNQGQRRSLGNSPNAEKPTSIARLLGMMEESARRRRADMKKRKHPGLKGIFGGGE